MRRALVRRQERFFWLWTNRLRTHCRADGLYSSGNKPSSLKESWRIIDVLDQSKSRSRSKRRVEAPVRAHDRALGWSGQHPQDSEFESGFAARALRVLQDSDARPIRSEPRSARNDRGRGFGVQSVSLLNPASRG